MDLLLQQICNTTSEQEALAEDTVALLDVTTLDTHFATLVKEIQKSGKTSISNRQGAIIILKVWTTQRFKCVEAALISNLPSILNLVGDKVKKIASLTQELVTAMFRQININTVDPLVAQLLTSSNNNLANELRLLLIAQLCVVAKEQMALILYKVIPGVAREVHHLNKAVAAAARKTLLALCACCTNPDIVPLIPTLLTALEDRATIKSCVRKLASTTFVETVETATLALIAPILDVGFRGQDSSVKRGCARIVENMTMLVDDSRCVKPFVGTLLPLMEGAAKNVPDPEARNIIQKAVTTLTLKAQTTPLFGMVELKEVDPVFIRILKDHQVRPCSITTLAAHVLTMLNATGTDLMTVTVHLSPYFLQVTDAKTSLAIISALPLRKVVQKLEEQEHEVAEELCHCEFSLAFGNKVLIKKSPLILRKGLRYGLIGKNDSGKTSFMHAIAEYKVEGFPPEEELQTIFVQTDIPAAYADLTVREFICRDPKMAKLSEDKIVKALEDVGFVKGSPAHCDMAVGSLSGGWRMKLALTRAMLLEADILLLDEPTNHLDTYNKEWVMNYLTSRPEVTSIIVSHDSAFLDTVCTNMIHIDKYRLNFYKGNLSYFVSQVPSAKAFFELKSEFKFHFPAPGNLPGVKSKGKAIMKMSNVTFTYPKAAKPQLTGVTTQISLGSRIACVGINGAGKSTMIKLLTGELVPDSGTVWSHPNCRVGYIAQHAFHHIESQLDKTANEYIRWRYQYGVDREEAKKLAHLATPEEEKLMKRAIEIKDELGIKAKVIVERVLENRRMSKSKEQEYCCLCQGIQEPVWILSSLLVGWEKILLAVDQAIAIREAMYATPLTAANVTQHIAAVGLEEEFSTHVPMGALSGGQKVKVVLAAALWNRPHILILDEPTNYLDRESLGALAQAIREFEGGVVMVTHNSQFCDNLCPTVWHLENNTLNIKGDAEWMKEMLNQQVQKDAQVEMTDRYGNEVVLKKELTGKALKKHLRAKKLRKKARAKAGLPEESDSE